MRDYRLYFLDNSDHVRRAVDLQCEDDDHAIANAVEHAHPHARELWELSRLVRRFESSVS